MNKLSITYSGQSINLDVTAKTLTPRIQSGCDILFGDNDISTAEVKLNGMTISDGLVDVCYTVEFTNAKGLTNINTMSIRYEGDLSAHQLSVIFMENAMIQQ